MIATLWRSYSTGGCITIISSIAAVFSGLSALFCGVLHTWFLLLLMGTQFQAAVVLWKVDSLYENPRN